MRFAVGFGALVLLVVGCKHDEGVSTTTVRSGSPEGSRVTNVPDTPAERLARAVCVRERECARGRGLLRADALHMKEASCMVEVRPTTALAVERMACVASAGFERCVDAVAAASCDTPAGFTGEIVECRSSAMCP